jgi:hypothetical protein
VPAVPTQRTWADLDALDTTNLNGFVSDPIEFLLNPPAAMLRRTTTQSISTASWTAVAFTTEDLDTDVDGVGGHDSSSNPSRYTARYPGWYLVGGGVCFAANTTGQRGTMWSVNGTFVNGSNSLLDATASQACGVPARAIQVRLDEGDYVELMCWQSSGGALNVSGTTGEQPSMSVRWVSL